MMDKRAKAKLALFAVATIFGLVAMTYMVKCSHRQQDCHDICRAKHGSYRWSLRRVDDFDGLRCFCATQEGWVTESLPGESP